MQIKTRVKEKNIAKGKRKAKETATIGTQAQTMETDNDEHPGDHGSDVDQEAAFTGHTSIIMKGREKYKRNGYCLDPKDPANFLKLASSLNILLSDTLTDDQINEADNLIREYNVELIKVSRIPRTCPVFAVLNFIRSALWARCNKAESPLFNPHRGVYT